MSPGRKKTKTKAKPQTEDRKTSFRRRFESPELLSELLELAGSRLSFEEVVDAMRAAQAQGQQASELIPTFFDDEPRLPDPSYAKRMFENLLGAWDLVQAGKDPLTIGREREREKVKREKPEKPPPPVPFFPAEPDASFIESARRYLAADRRATERLTHAFENRHDALLELLDAEGLSDDGYLKARRLLFESFALIELGWPRGTRGVAARELVSGHALPPAPALLEREVEKQLPESGGHDEAARLRDVVRRGVRALWHARR